jgi:hypothetical protein
MHVAVCHSISFIPPLRDGADDGENRPLRVVQGSNAPDFLQIGRRGDRSAPQFCVLLGRFIAIID